MLRIKIVALLLVLSVLQVSAEVTYKRIVSLAPSLTQSIYYLGGQELIVGCTSYCHAAKGDNKPVVASAVKPNMEKIVSMKPDLVLVSNFTSPKDVETLRKFGIKVEAFPTAKSFEQICDQFTTLGKLTGKTEKAKTILDSSRAKIKQLQEGMTKKGKKIFIQIGATPIFAVIPNTFMNDYITMSGSQNILQQLTKGAVSREAVVAGRPDYIFIVTMGIVAEEEKNEWMKFGTIPAVKNGAIEVINSDIACLPTPITFTQTLESIMKYIQSK